MKQHIIAVDFDSTLATYVRPWKYNLLGQPIEPIIKLIRTFYNQGKYIMIFTGRLETPELAQWLKDTDVPYHAINKQPAHHELASRFKPYYSLLIDDKAMNPMRPNGCYKMFHELVYEASGILEINDKERDEKDKS